MNRKILIMGATGATGKLLTQSALKEEDTAVKVLVRNPARLMIRHDKLSVVSGNVLRYEDVLQAVNEVDVVVWAVGGHDAVRSKRADSQNNLCVRGTKNVIAGMKESGVKRIIAISSWGVGESYSRLPFLFRIIIFPMILKKELADKEKQEALLKSSGLDYTVIRPSRLTNKEKNTKLKVSHKLSYNHFSSTPRMALAAFVLAEARNPAFTNKIVEITG